MKTFTTDEIKKLLDYNFWSTVNAWIIRGDGIAVYQNTALDSLQAGERQFVSFGSSVCQLEAKEPPQRLPDIGGHINWRYQLEGVYHGKLLEKDEEGKEFHREVLGKQLPPDLWEQFEHKPPTCDLCDSRAVWRHPKGGLRCRKCPRPNE